MTDSLGVYISVPFCKAKCTYCNFASGVFGAGRIDAYVERVCEEIGCARAVAERFKDPRLKPTDSEAPHRGRPKAEALGYQAAAHPRNRCADGLAGVELPGVVDSVYYGGGTSSLLSAEQVRRVFAALRGEFAVTADAEVTLECAPGQLADATLEELLRQGMNRVSFGVQSFVDREAAGVGRLHTREVCLAEIARVRAAGVGNINVDLIVGLPRQTWESLRESVDVAIASGVPHVSVYMLEVDEDSRLGKEVLSAGNREQGAGRQGTGSREQGIGMRYGAAEVPGDDAIAEWYAEACGRLEAGGVRQYEISNFAREGFASRHNVKYWRREPYVGFGLDAHSMLRSGAGGVRWANGDELESYLKGTGDREQSRVLSSQLSVLEEVLPSVEAKPNVEVVGPEQAFEEAMFLGLRMNEGVELEALRVEFGGELVSGAIEALGDVVEAGLAMIEGERVRLTARGRMVSNEVFGRLLVGAAVGR